MDDQRAQISEAFYIGQSVRSNVLDVGDLSEAQIFQIIFFIAFSD